MRLKNSIYGLLVASCVGLSACSDSYLDETIYSSYGNNVVDMNAKILGIHYLVGEILGYSDNQGYAGIWQDGTDVGAPGDVQGVETPFYKYSQLTSENAGVSFLWSQLYEIINAANQIINDEENPTEEQIAEARFFRAYAYNQLVTGWGGVPLVTESATSPTTDYTRNTVAEVDAVIEEDLTYAISNLPDLSGLANESRICKDAARQLAGEAYLRMGMRDSSYFSKAETALTAIISGGNYSLITERYGAFTSEYGDYYHDMFRYGNQRRSEGNTEGIWTFEMEYDTEVSGGTIGAPQQRRNWVSAFHKLDGMVNADSIGGRGNGRLRLSNYVKYGIFEDGDIRNSNYNIRRILYYNNVDWEGDTYYLDSQGYRVPDDDPTDPDVVTTVTVGVGDRVYCHQADTLNVLYPHTTKWGGYDTTDDFGWALVKDFPMMRYAETYLLRAEARFRQGDTSGAAEDINVIRDRAFQDYREIAPSAGVVYSSDIDIDFILDERIRELVGEENRRFTLMRTNELTNRVNMMVNYWPETDSQKTIEGYDSSIHTLLPIPLTEIQLNKDADLEQNPGY